MLWESGVWAAQLLWSLSAVNMSGLPTQLCLRLCRAIASETGASPASDSASLWSCDLGRKAQVFTCCERASSSVEPCLQAGIGDWQEDSPVAQTVKSLPAMQETQV